jgi:hypothetical protein
MSSAEFSSTDGEELSLFAPKARVYGRAKIPEHSREYSENSDPLQHLNQRIQLLRPSHFDDLSKGS